MRRAVLQYLPCLALEIEEAPPGKCKVRPSAASRDLPCRAGCLRQPNPSSWVAPSSSPRGSSRPLARACAPDRRSTRPDLCRRDLSVEACSSLDSRPEELCFPVQDHSQKYPYPLCVYPAPP